MKQGFLSEYISSASVKRLSAVEADPSTSNQHEFNATRDMQNIFGTEEAKFPAMFLYLADDDENCVTAKGSLTWYDARANSPHRSAEYRLYFDSNEVVSKMQVSDLLFLIRRNNESTLVIISPSNTTSANQLLWLLGLDFEISDRFSTKVEHDLDDCNLTYGCLTILETLGITVTTHQEDSLEDLLHTFSGRFPSTRDFSAYARDKCISVSIQDNSADDVLLAWMGHEELLFRTLEQHLLGERIRQGFISVDDFIQVSLSVQNRRKARVGAALENHLEHIFISKGVSYTRGGKTEGNSKPDFIFPSIEAYRDPNYSATSLKMLGVKSTCKDRWRQVLAEANRISHKHLLTLEAGISISQTDEMKSHSLQLVIPRPLHTSYRLNQQLWLMDITSFICSISNN